MLIIGIAFLVGGLVGRLIRDATPWLLSLKDRSRPFKWPWLEALTALLFAHAAWLNTEPLQVLKWTVFIIILLAITSTDYAKKLIPNRLSFGGMALGVILSTVVPGDLLAIDLNQSLLDQMEMFTTPLALKGLFISLTGLLTGFLGLEILRRIFSGMAGMEVMGMGDAKLLGLIGAFLGPGLAIFTLIPASLFGIINGLFYRWLFKIPHSPFGPAIALAGWFSFYYHRAAFTLIDRFYEALYTLPPWFMSVFFVILMVILIGLVLRMRHRSAEYARQIDEDYEQIADDIDE